MTGSVPEAKRAYESAATVVEQFLGLFPDYLPALRLHAELCRGWLSGMSFRDDWEAIVLLAHARSPSPGSSRRIPGWPRTRSPSRRWATWPPS